MRQAGQAKRAAITARANDSGAIQPEASPARPSAAPKARPASAGRRVACGSAASAPASAARPASSGSASCAVHHQADRAEHQQHRRRRGRGAPLDLGLPVARRAPDEIEGERDEHAAREARRGMEFEQQAERAAERGRNPVVERRIEHPQRAGDARHEQRAGGRHAVHDAEADGVVGLPGIVPGEAGQDERGRDQRERGGSRR
jgi:hypothetical protein